MLATKFHCPACGALLKTVRPLPEGKEIKCPRCAVSFIPGAVPAEQAAGRAANEEQTPTRTFDRGGPEERVAITPAPAAVADGGSSPTMTFAQQAGPAGVAAQPESEAVHGAKTQSPRKSKRRSPLPVLVTGVFALVVISGGVLGAAWFGIWPFHKRQETSGPTAMLPLPGPPSPAGGTPQPAKKEDEEPPDEVDPNEKPRQPVSLDGTPWLGLGVGNRALEIEGEDLDGKSFKLSDHRGKIVLLDFWGDWCPFCREMYPYEKALVQRLAGKPFVLLGVNSDKNKAAVRKVVEKHQLAGVRSWWDGAPTGKVIARQWNVRNFPTLFVIDHKGVIREVIYGRPRDTKPLDDLLDRLIAEAEGKASTSQPKGADKP